MAARTVRTVVAVTLLLAATGCNRGLSRSDAQQQLEAKYAREADHIYIPLGDRGPTTADAPVPYLRIEVPTKLEMAFPEIVALSKGGLLKVSLLASGVGEPGGAFDHIKVEPTDAAKPFLMGTYPPGDTSLPWQCRGGCIKLMAGQPKIEITGVGEPADLGGLKVSTVTFRIVSKRTRVGELTGKPALDQDQKERREAFVKYDAGWRLEEGN